MGLTTIDKFNKSIAITGATGFVGRSLCAAFAAAGWHVIATHRAATPPHRDAARWVNWDLAEPPPPEICNANVIVHLACDCIAQRIARAGEADATDVRATRQLRQGWREASAERPEGKFIFVSSRGAGAAAANQYGRIKYQCERLLTEPTDVIVRPSLVFGDSDRGLYALLRGLLTRLPVLPVPATPASFVPIHIAEFCAQVVELATSRNSGDGPEISMPGTGAPMTLKELLSFICKGEDIAAPVMIGVPAPLLLYPLLAMSPLSNRSYFLKERLLGLFNPTAGR